MDSPQIISIGVGLLVAIGQWALRRAVTEFDKRLERVEARIEMVARLEERSFATATSIGQLQGTISKVTERMDGLAEFWRKQHEKTKDVTHEQS